MKVRHHRLLLCTVSLAAALSAGDAGAFPNPFRKKARQTAPDTAELATSEAAAAALIKRAEEAEAAGRISQARSIYRDILLRHQFSSHAPVAKFRLAAAYEREGKYAKAFETYQELVETYRQSRQFGEAVDRQYAIAKLARTEKIGSFFGISKKMGSSQVIEMYQKVIDNAPRGPHAAEAQLEIARIHEEEGNHSDAIDAYRKLAEEYPRSPYAAEAQAKVGRGYLEIVREGSRDRSALDEARAATEQSSGLFPSVDPVRSADLTVMRGEIDELTAENAFKTARFYEKSGNARAALIYYSDVLRSPAGQYFAEARDRVNEITASDPKLLETLPQGILTAKALAVPAAVDVKSRPNYFGPPPPPSRVASVIRKPGMRSDRDQIPITPIDEPDLPTGTDSPSFPDPSLLDPTIPPEPGVLRPGDTLPDEPELPSLDPPSLDSLNPDPTPPAPGPGTTEPEPEPEKPSDAPAVEPDPSPAPEPPGE